MMSNSRWTTLVGSLVIATLALALVMLYQTIRHLSNENETLRHDVAQMRAEKDGPPAAAPPALIAANLAGPDFSELLRLRGEVGLLRRETNRLSDMLSKSEQHRGPEAGGADGEPAGPLPDDYPKTAEGAVKGIFDAWARGDWEAFFKNFGEPVVPRDVYDRAFSDPNKSNYLYGMQIASLGQPTNGPGQNSWLVPYKLRFRDGSEKEFQLHVAQDPRTQRWFFKGGF